MCEVEDVVRWARSRRAWMDHVERMTDDKIAKIIER